MNRIERRLVRGWSLAAVSSAMALSGACGPQGSPESLDTAGGTWDWPADVEWVARSSEDLGSLCLVAGGQDELEIAQAVSDPTPQRFRSGAPIVAVYGVCFSPDCHRDVTLTLDADGLDFTGRAEWEEVALEEGMGCSLVCKPYRTTLELPPLAEGRHTVEFAGQELTLEVPGRQTACLGASPFGKSDLKIGEPVD